MGVESENNVTTGSNGGGKPAGVGDQPIDPEIARKIARVRAQVRESFGNVAMAMMMLPRYRYQTLADLQHLLLEPLIRDRIAIAYPAHGYSGADAPGLRERGAGAPDRGRGLGNDTASAKDNKAKPKKSGKASAAEEAQPTTPLAPAERSPKGGSVSETNQRDPLSDVTGMAIWASVSEEVDTKIREQIKAAVFPVRLKAEDWNSGKINWLLDIIAPDQKTTTAVIANFKQVVKTGDLRLHPIVTRLVDKETLEKMGAAPVGKAGSDRKNMDTE